MLSNLHITAALTIGERLLDDLIYSFLLQSDFPRASIVFDLDLLNPIPTGNSGSKIPSFIIVDPETAQPLAVIEVVDAIEGDKLRQIAIETGAYAASLGSPAIQGFVIRVDVRGRTEAEQVNFYRIWPNSKLQQLSSKNFPDLASLKVARKLIEGTLVEETQEPSISAYDTHKAETPIPEADLYLPAIVLLLLMFADIAFTASFGKPLLSLPQSVLAIGVALLFALPAAIRHLRKITR